MYLTLMKGHSLMIGWKLLQASLISEYRMKLKTKEEHETKKTSKEKLPIATVSLGGAVKCYACGGPHKKGDPSCKAGPFDVHECAPPEFKTKQEDKKRKYGSKSGKGNTSPQKKSKNDGEKKYCNAFNFGKGTCRYGAKCRFIHEDRTGSTGKGKGKGGFSEKQKKMVSTMVAAAVKKSNEKFVKEFKRQKNARDKGSKDDDDGSGSDNDLASMVARCFMAPMTNTIPRSPASFGPIVLKASLHNNVKKSCGIDSDAGMSISTMRDDFPLWLDNSERVLRTLPSPSGINGGESKIGGTGPMIVRAVSGELFIDPDGLYMQAGEDQPNFRVLST